MRVFASILILVGYIAIVLPYALDQFARVGQTSTITAYAQEVDSLQEQEIAEAFARCDEYNKKIAKEHEENYYHYSSDFDFSQEYLDLPIKGLNDIASLEIPKINVKLPIAHGTEDSVLQNRLGHMYGTSFPSGGPSTHSVIAGHTALRTSEMFDRLDELEEGDEFYITILNETHVYRVDQIVVIEPDVHDEYMQVIPGKDYVTLYTCTPYGINTHRLLVRGERVGDYVAEKTESGIAVVETDIAMPVIKLSILAILPVIIIYLINKYLL